MNRTRLSCTLQKLPLPISSMQTDRLVGTLRAVYGTAIAQYDPIDKVEVRCDYRAAYKKRVP